MTQQLFMLIQLILFVFLIKSTKAKKFHTIKDFKVDVEQVKGSKEIIVKGDFAMLEDLKPFYIGRALDLLILQGDSIYLLGYMRSIDNRPITVKKLVIISIPKKTLIIDFLNKDPLNGIANFIGVQEIEANGIDAIKQLFKVYVPYDCVSKSIRLVIDREMTQKEVERIIKDSGSNQFLPDHRELHIEGPFPSSIINFLNKKTKGHTKKLSITCRASQVYHIQEDEGSKISLGSGWKELTLNGGAVFLAFSDDFTLFQYKIDELTLDFTDFPTGRFVKDKRINLLECDSLCLINKTINLLPLISLPSLMAIRRLCTIYKGQDVVLSHILSDYLKCEELLEEEASCQIFWNHIDHTKEFPDNDPYQRLKEIFGRLGNDQDKTNDNKTTNEQHIPIPMAISPALPSLHAKDLDCITYLPHPISTTANAFTGSSVIRSPNDIAEESQSAPVKKPGIRPTIYGIPRRTVIATCVCLFLLLLIVVITLSI